MNQEIKTKEEILGKLWIALNKRESDPEMHLYLSPDEMDMIYEAMDEYAKQVSIEFTEWKDKNCKVVMECKEDGDIIWEVIGNEDQGFRLPQLYELFSKQTESK